MADLPQPLSTNATGTVQSAPPAATDLASLVTLLFSFAALSDWLKLVLLGGVIETCRRFFSTLYQWFDEAFFLTVSFAEDDESYEWIMYWLSKQPPWTKARRILITTRTFGLNGQAVLVPGEETNTQSLGLNKRGLAYLPSLSSSSVLWYKGHWMRATRVEVEAQSYYRRREEMLYLRIFSRSHNILNQLLLEAKRLYKAAQEDTISVLVSSSSNEWRHLANRPKRSMNSIILDPGVKDKLLADAKDFLASRSWYATRGIPFRRGYLLYGAPGSGKTSLIHSLAGELGLDVYVLSLTRSGLDDTSLTELISMLPERCIALMEDIDAALTQKINRDTNSEEDNKKLAAINQANPQASPPPPGTSSPTISRVSLSGLLNALDGIGAQEGRILFATTNKYSSLDPALCRPGRMDVHVEFKLASKFQARELYKAFYMPDVEKETPPENGTANSDGTSEEEKSADLIDLSRGDEPDHLGANDSVVVTGSLHQHHAPSLSRDALAVMAKAFADAIPERVVSMAALQGYLMMYKTQPLDAVKNARSWAETEISDRQKRERVVTDTTDDTTKKQS